MAVYVRPHADQLRSAAAVVTWTESNLLAATEQRRNGAHKRCQKMQRWIAVATTILILPPSSTSDLGHLLRHVQEHLLDSHASLLLASSVDGLPEDDATIRLQDYDIEKRRAQASCFLFPAIRAEHDAWAILQTCG